MDKSRFFYIEKLMKNKILRFSKGGTFKRKNRDFEAPQKPL